jgi:hypothetical protein
MMESMVLPNISDSSRQAIDWAYTVARRDGRPVGSQELLMGIYQVHGTDSPLRQLLRAFQVPDQAFLDLLAVRMPDPSQHPESLSDLSVIDDDANSIIERGRKLAQQYNRREKGLMRLKDLFGAVLMEWKTSSRSILTSALQTAQHSISIDEISKAYLEYLAQPDSTDLVLFMHHFFPSLMEEQAGMALTGFSADTRSTEDLVGVGSEVASLGYLIANKDLTPPLAIGLFGDWGSGKSFFMQSLKEHIHNLTRLARESGRPQKDIKIFKHIVQIEFNAWHYVEGELWASLVETIFQNLQAGEKDTNNLLQQRQRVWIENLESLRARQGMVQVLKEELDRQRDSLKGEIENLETLRDQALNDLSDLKVADILSAVELSPQDKARYNQILTQNGIAGGRDSAVEFFGALTDLRAELSRAGALNHALQQRGWKWWLGIIAVIAGGPLISVLLNLLPTDIPGVTNALISLSAFLGGLTAIIKHSTIKLNQAIGQVEKAQHELEAKKRDKEQEYAKQIALKEDEFTKINAEFDRTVEEDQELARQIAAVEQELNQITPRRVLLDFIQERTVSEDYRKRLGIAALIRRDFEQLWQYIQKQNEEFIAKDEGDDSKADEHLINRIVLYIDDLDRCPSDRVVEVLQAIHLLLAFPLFVVVVAVDSRWLSQSLNKKYEGLLAGSLPQDRPGNGVPPATPQNYLEKIFQIPFWVRPLTPDARVRIVDALFKQSRPMENDVDGGAAQEPAELAWKPEERVQQYSKKIKIEMNPPGLETDDREQKFIAELAGLLGETPRSVKRFVNLYWLMKTMALTYTPDFNDEQCTYPEYKQLLFLLAVLTGLPAVSGGFFHLLHRCQGTPHIKGGAQAGAEPALKDLIADLRGKYAAPTSANTAALVELERLSAWAATVEGGRWQEIKLSELNNWAPQVQRFSFQMEEV